MLKRLARRAVLLSMIFTAFLATQPAQAASGGGCSGNWPISSCISVSGGNVVADFYMNATPDISRYWARMEIRTTNVGTKWTGYYRIDRTGRFGPVSFSITTMPVSSGSAVNIVHLYTDNYTAHGTEPSPRVYY
ncbi:hypothetical protein AB0C10_25120 [Microbispora amethystogenes]|uniref:hypothetical protein n=1 Tax=Microbispora amethystogenes TaxID=1427754 RepID=UPI0033E06C59